MSLWLGAECDKLEPTSPGAGLCLRVSVPRGTGIKQVVESLAETGGGRTTVIRKKTLHLKSTCVQKETETETETQMKDSDGGQLDTYR